MSDSAEETYLQTYLQILARRMDETLGPRTAEDPYGTGRASRMKPGEIAAVLRNTEQQTTPITQDQRALLALRDLLVSFLEATDKGCPDSMKAMSIEQVRLLNQLHLAVGL